MATTTLRCELLEARLPLTSDGFSFAWIDTPGAGRGTQLADLNGDDYPDIVASDNKVFDSSDLVQVMLAGKYESEYPNEATFAEDDWNNDGSFDSADLHWS